MRAHVLAGDEPSFEPLAPAKVDAARQRLPEAPGIARELAGRMGGGDTIEVLELAAASLAEGLAGLPANETPDRRFLSGVLLTRDTA